MGSENYELVDTLERIAKSPGKPGRVTEKNS